MSTLAAELPNNCLQVTPKTTVIILCYVVPQWLFRDTEIHDLELPRMTILRQNLFRVRQLMSLRFWLSDKTVWKFAELRSYCQQPKCSPGILVYSRVWLMWIFAGVRWRGVSNESGVVVNCDFRFFRSLYYLLELLQTRPKLLYCTIAPCWLFIDTETDDFEWPGMAILRQNVFRYRHLMVWRSGFRRKLYGDLQSYAYTVSGKKM